MKNMLDYVTEYGTKSFEEYPLTTIDILVLTELSYLSLDQIIPYSLDVKDGIRFQEVWAGYDLIREEVMRTNQVMQTKERVELLSLVAHSPRYQDLKAFGYTNEVDIEAIRQFAVMLVQIDADRRLVAFRGTDETLVGWKEDFRMTYLPEIPAQASASNYFEKQAATFDGTFLISGHSKGGNLALYAGITQAEDLQNRIEHIYCFDAPGMHRAVLETPGYKRMIDKTSAIIPEGSIVGLMLETAIPYRIIRSNSKGPDQHGATTWIVEDGDFISVDTVTKESILTDQTFKKWVELVSDKDLELFFDAFFDLLFASGLDSLNDLTDFKHHMQEFINHANQMDDETKEILIRVAKVLIQTRYELWRESWKTQEKTTDFTLPSLTELAEQLPTWEEIKASLTPKVKGIEITYQETQENEAIRHYYQERLEQKKEEHTKVSERD